MSESDILQVLQSDGARFAVQDDQLRVRAPLGVLTSDVRVELAKHRTRLLASLKERAGIAFSIFQQAVREVSSAWNTTAERSVHEHLFQASWNRDAMEEISSFIRDGDVDGASAAVRAWKSRWLDALSAPTHARNRVELSQEQSDAVEKITDWYDGPASGQTITLGGYAGTGKTTIIRHLLDEFGHLTVAVCALTGKAVDVLRRKGVAEAQTIHSLMYTLDGDDGHGRLVFRRNQTIDAELVIVDEASMISAALHRDLVSFGSRIIYVGDHGQLEPVGDDCGLMHDPDIRLETIHRQARDSDIVRFAHELRNGTIPTEAEACGEVTLLPAKEFLNLAGKVDVLLCAYNKTRHVANKRTRETLGCSGPYPQVGERVICLQNDRDLGIYNGMTLKVTGVGREKGPVVHLDLADEQGQVLREVPAVKQQFGRNRVRDRAPRGIALLDFGYCLTVHKAQGSEWDTVAVLDQPCTKWSMRRWRYTAATRAAKRLYYCSG